MANRIELANRTESMNPNASSHRRIEMKQLKLNIGRLETYRVKYIDTIFEFKHAVARGMRAPAARSNNRRLELNLRTELSRRIRLNRRSVEPSNWSV